MGVAHDTELEILLFTAVTLGGIGLAYAAMPNLIIDAVPQGETGEATGFNTVMRMIGASLGGQVCATILTGSRPAGSAFPSDAGFRTAFLVCAGAAIAGAGMAMLIPVVRGPHPVHLSALEEIGAASPVAEPTYSSPERGTSH